MTYLSESIQPTRIYHKRCSHCDLNYLGKTTAKDIEKYPGSGLTWSKHLKEHNAVSIHMWNSEWFYDKSIVEYALNLSEELNIVESERWANEKFENGLDGGWTDEQRQKSKDSVFKKYGVRSVFEIHGMQEKIKKVMIEKYGVVNGFQTEKAKQSMFEKFGDLNPFETEEVKKKIKQTNIERFGFEHHRQRPEEKERLSNVQKDKAKRPLYQEFKKLALKNNISLKGKYLKSDEWLLEQIQSLQ